VDQGQEVRSYKLRTMEMTRTANKEALGQSTERNGRFQDANDPRVTRFGTGLRKYSLDEFRSCGTVTAGHELSRPRPHPWTTSSATRSSIAASGREAPESRLWQVEGAADPSFDTNHERIGDIENWSLRGLEICARPFSVGRGRD